MNLCLDIGNTKAKAAIFDHHEMVKGSFMTNIDATNMKAFVNNYPVDRVLISSTKNQMEDYINGLPSTASVELLSHSTELPIEILYKTPESLGPDRIAAVCGAAQQFEQSNCLVVDAGTCITYDYIDAQKKYHGGNIAPGIDMRLKAMNVYTSKLPIVHKEYNRQLLGHSTRQALQNGACLGVAFEIEALYEHLLEEDSQINIILTGGDALFLAEIVKKEIFVVPNLVLLGLNEILLHNSYNED